MLIFSSGSKQTQNSLLGFQTRFSSRRDESQRDSWRGGKGGSFPPRGRGGKSGYNGGYDPRNRNHFEPDSTRDRYDNRNQRWKHSENYRGEASNSNSHSYGYHDSKNQDRYEHNSNRYRGNNQQKGYQRNEKYQERRNRW